MESHRGRGPDHRITRDTRKRKGLGAEKPCAVDRFTDPVVLLQEPDRQSSRGKMLRRIEPGRARADHDYIPGHGAPIICGAPLSPFITYLEVPALLRITGNQTFRPRCSHRPRKVIQKDRAISRGPPRSLAAGCRAGRSGTSAARRDIPVGVDLGHPGESRAAPCAARGIPGTLSMRDDLPVTPRVDFSPGRRARGPTKLMSPRRCSRAGAARPWPSPGGGGRPA